MIRILRLSPERALARASKHFLVAASDRCPKCRSTFVGQEPAFVHCRCCGAMARIAWAPDRPPAGRRAGAAGYETRRRRART